MMLEGIDNLGPLPEGAVCVADWGSVLTTGLHSLRHGIRRATSLKEGGKYQLTRGMVKVNSVLPSRLVTLIFSPWEQTMVLTM